MKPPTLAQVEEVWRKVCKDPEAHKALAKLAKAGFHIRELTPQDPTFKQPCWADYIAALPFLPSRPSCRRIHRGELLKKHMPLVRTLRFFADKLDEPFCEKRIVMTQEHSVRDLRRFSTDLRQAADVITKFISWDWYIRQKDPRKAVIAELRATIRSRTGKPHDAELITLIDTAFRAAGVKDDFYPDASNLDRIEKLEKEGRVKATCRLNFVAGISSSPKVPIAAYSTSSLRNRRKRVE